MMELFEKYVGLVFDNRYRIEQVIGIGGMAVVFKATDLLMRRTVAVKILKDEISGDEQSVKRFINESKAVAMLSHQNIVNIYDVSVRENIKYIVMEYVDGITLKSYMQHREVLNLREIISYTTQILRALDHAHKKGIVHRDIKPQNIMLLKNGIIKVMDFGIAKLPNAETITMTDKAIGTVYYISPEQVTGSDIDARSDLYSLGTVMYEMATGRLPFTAETPVSVALMQVNDEADMPREINSHIPTGLEQIIMRAMEKDPAERYQSAEEMLSQLLKLRENPKIIFKEKSKASKNKQKSSRPKKKTSKSMFPIIMGVTLAFMIAAGISVYYMVDKLFISGSLNNYISIEVEDFTQARYTDELADWFRDSSYYQIPTIKYVYHDTVPEGVVVSQDPAPAESRKVLPGKQKCEITIEISKGPHTMMLKDYTIQDYRIVSDELRKLGLIVNVENITSEIYEIGYVVKTEPGAGTVVKENDTVTIYVSRGSDTVKTAVPNFIGLTEAQVLIKLMDYSLTVGDVEYVKSDTTPGLIVEQSLDVYYEVPKYTEIDFKISGGPSYSGDGTTIPTASDMMPSYSDMNTGNKYDKDDSSDKDSTEETKKETVGGGSPIFKDPDSGSSNSSGDDWWDGGVLDDDEFFGT